MCDIETDSPWFTTVEFKIRNQEAIGDRPTEIPNVATNSISKSGLHDIPRCPSVALISTCFLSCTSSVVACWLHCYTLRYGRITSTKSLSFCITTVFASPTNNAVFLLLQSRDCSCYLGRRVVAPPLLRAVAPPPL